MIPNIIKLNHKITRESPIKKCTLKFLLRLNIKLEVPAKFLFTRIDTRFVYRIICFRGSSKTKGQIFTVFELRRKLFKGSNSQISHQQTHDVPPLLHQPCEQIQTTIAYINDLVLTS